MNVILKNIIIVFLITHTHTFFAASESASAVESSKELPTLNAEEQKLLEEIQQKNQDYEAQYKKDQESGELEKLRLKTAFNKIYTIVAYKNKSGILKVAKYLITPQDEKNINSYLSTSISNHLNHYGDCRKEDFQNIKFLLAIGANPNKITLDKLPLLLAINRKDTEVVEVLVAKGADVNISTLGTKPLCLAAEKKYADIAKILIKHGATCECLTQECRNFLESLGYNFTTDFKEPELTLTPEIQQQLEEIKEQLKKDYRGHTALTKAIEDQRINVALYLIQHQPDLILRKTKHDGTPLMLAIEKELPSIARAIIHKEPRAINQEIRGYITPLYIAITKKNAPIAQLLIEKGANVNSTSRTESAPLVNAFKYNLPSIVDLLFTRGANLAYIDENNRSLLHALADEPKALQFIIDKILAQKNGLDLLNQLINDQAKKDIQNSDIKSTPLMYAQYFPESVILLLSHGADITIPNSEGYTILDFIIHNLLRSTSDSDNEFNQKQFVILQKLLNHKDIAKIINKENPVWHATPLCFVLTNLDEETKKALKAESNAKSNGKNEESAFPQTKKTRVAELLIHAGAQCTNPELQMFLTPLKKRVTNNIRSGAYVARALEKIPSGATIPETVAQEIGEFLGAKREPAKSKQKPNPWTASELAKAKLEKKSAPSNKDDEDWYSDEEDWYAQ